MRTVVTDIDMNRPRNGQEYTVYIQQGELAGNMLIPREAVGNNEKAIEAAQAYLDTHEDEIPRLKDLPNITEAGVVTRYLVRKSLNESSGMVFVERDFDEVNTFLAALHEQDKGITTFTDVIKSLEEDFQKFPVIRDSIEYHNPDEYGPGKEPLLCCYTNLTNFFTINKRYVPDGEVRGK